MSLFVRRALLLGTFTAIGPLGTDMYLPALPAIARDLRTEEGVAQLSLMSFFVALALGQAVYGPVSDMLGRKRPLLLGFALEAAASVGCAYASTVEMLIALRFVQGLGACAGMVVARAAARDLYSGTELARLFSLMMLVLGVSPILAPIIGSSIMMVFPWHAIFWCQAVFGLFCVVLLLLFFTETHEPGRRLEGGLRPVFATYGRLLLDFRFLGIVLSSGLSQAGFFAYLAGSPFVYITLHGVPPALYSVLFGVNAIGLIGMSQLNGRLIARLGALRLIRTAILFYLLAALVLATLALLRVDSLPATAALLFIEIACMGCILPIGSMLALERHGTIAGSASALMGSLQFAIGALASALVGAVFNGTSLPMAGTIAGCAALSFLLSRRYLTVRAGAFP